MITVLCMEGREKEYLFYSVFCVFLDTILEGKNCKCVGRWVNWIQSMQFWLHFQDDNHLRKALWVSVKA